MKMIELYSGSGSVSASFRKHGFETLEIDIRKRKGVCEPDIRADIGKLRRSEIKKCGALFYPQVVWCSFPCTVFSYGAGNYHFRDGEPVTETAAYFLRMLKTTLLLIDELSPEYFFIENPRGLMRYNKTLLDWLTNRGMVKQLTYSSYGGATIKPTNIFTNAFDWQPKPLDRYGRGAKNPSGKVLTNLTLVNRYKVPGPLSDEIADYCRGKIAGTKKRSAYFSGNLEIDFTGQSERVG